MGQALSQGTFAAVSHGVNALVFLVREGLARDPGDLGGFVRARKPVRLPVVLSREECGRLFAALDGTLRLMAELLYGSGLRLTELLRLRIKDVDVERRQLVVRAGKGAKDRLTMVPEKLVEPLREHLAGVRRQWEADVAAGCHPRLFTMKPFGLFQQASTL